MAGPPPPQLDRVGGGRDGVPRELILAALEGGQDVVNDLAVPPDTNPEPRKLVGAEGLDDVAQPVVAAGRPAATKPEPAQGQIGVIGNDQQIGFVLGVGVPEAPPAGAAQTGS